MAALGLAPVAVGCGKSGSTSPPELALEREDLVFVCHALQQLEGQAGAEVTATRAAWPYVYRGLPDRRSDLYPPEVADAIEAAQRLTLPALLGEHQAAALTGPASSIAGTYRTFAELAGRGWRMIGAAIYQAEHGTPASARFARANVAIYIESVYDAHFALAQISKGLLKAYAKLGGEKVFDGTLTQAEIDGLAHTYDEEHDELVPHGLVKLGS